MPAPKAITVTHRTENDNEIFTFTCVTPGDRSFTLSFAQQNPDGSKTLAQMADASYRAIQATVEARVGELDSALGPAGAAFTPSTGTAPAVLAPIAAPPPSIDALQAKLAEQDAKIAATQAELVAAIAAKDPALAAQVNAMIETAKQEVPAP